jgi:cyclophilin family peptidyl-prolyl cis-trans isomerase
MNKVYILLIVAIAIVAGFFFLTRNTETDPRDGDIAPPTNIPMTVSFTTNKGEITLELFTTDAPKTTENFITLAKDGFFDGTKFHRVIAGFMIQGGDPLSKDDSMRTQWGTGGPGYTFEDEIHANNKNVVGTIAMANAGPNTNGSQFFINLADNTFLNTKHTVFGKVTAGLDVAREIEAVATNATDQPLEDIIVEKVTVQ